MSAFGLPVHTCTRAYRPGDQLGFWGFQTMSAFGLTYFWVYRPGQAGFRAYRPDLLSDGLPTFGFTDQARFAFRSYRPDLLSELRISPMLELADGTLEKRVVVFLCADDDYEVILLAILLEGTRQLHRYYEKAAGVCLTRSRDTYPPVMQLVNERASLVVAVLQYMSSLVGSPSDCTRLFLVFAIRGVRTFADWKRLWPTDVELLSNAVLLISASLERRQRRGIRGSIEACIEGQNGNPKANHNRKLQCSTHCWQASC